MLYRFAILSILVAISGCASFEIQHSPPVVKQLESKHSADQIFTAAVQRLAKDGWLIKTTDRQAGIIVTEPKQFVIIPRGVFDIKAPMTSELQFIIQNKAYTLQINDRCQMNPGPGWDDCHLSDVEAQRVVPGHDQELIDQFGSL